MAIHNPVTLCGEDSSGESEAITSTSNGLSTVLTGGMDARGNYPETVFDTLSGSGTNDNDVLFTLTDARPYTKHTIHCTANVVDVQINLDGTNWVTIPIETHLGTGTITAADIEIASGEVGVVYLKARQIRILQKGASAATAYMASHN